MPALTATSTARPSTVLCHNTLQLHVLGFHQSGDGGAFVRQHLLNPQEFWTLLPLPSVAVNDPLFRNAPENNWSGQCEGLTYQRAIIALERYGYEPLVTKLGRKLLDATIRGGYVFTQQFDPFTGEPSRVGMVSHEVLLPRQRRAVSGFLRPDAAGGAGVHRAYLGDCAVGDEVWFSLGSGCPMPMRSGSGEMCTR